MLAKIRLTCFFETVGSSYHRICQTDDNYPDRQGRAAPDFRQDDPAFWMKSTTLPGIAICRLCVAATPYLGLTAVAHRSERLAQPLTVAFETVA